jgi:DNA polymerase III subunit alpha
MVTIEHMALLLATHSAFSLLEGLPLPEELAQAAAARGMEALGLSDHRLLTGTVEFAGACKRAGIQPILGLEIDLSWETPGSSPLTLFATGLDGWTSLCRLSSALQLGDVLEEGTPGETACCTLEQLSAYTAGLLAVFAPLGEAGGRRLERLKDLFPGRLYAGLPDPQSSLPMAALARRLRLPAVAMPPVYYLKPEQADLQRTVTAIRLNSTRERLSAAAVAPAQACFLSPAELSARYSGLNTALAMTGEIAARCKFDLPLGVARMPRIPLPPGLSAAQVLRQKAEAGALRLYGELNGAVQARLDHELEVIARQQYEPIFLIVEELLSFARHEGIPYSSRGSAASSLVAHCLGITSPDPLRLDLYFERFLNPARTTPPDIDTDLCSRRRDEVIQHAFEVFGADRVAMVATINRYRPRSAVSDVAKAYGLSPTAAHQLSEQLPYSFFARMDESSAGGEPISPLAELRQRYPGQSYQRIFADADALLKLPRHLSVHPGGLIVAPGPLTDLVPVMRSGAKGVTITQFDLDAVETLGLVKIDLLGIRGLTVVGDVASFIHANQPGQFASRLAVLDSTPAADPATSDRLEKGGTIGCFQIESPGMRSTLRDIHARTEDDLLAALALYRPGPIQGGQHDAFIRRYRHEEDVIFLHPALEPLLADTYGVILYQEQVLRIAHALAGFSLAEADLLRRAMSHFDPGKQMQALQDKFIAAAERNAGVPPETGQRIWEMMAAFAGYGFPKAHAASYAQVAWRSAWCKTHFPAEFMAAVLANWGGYYGQGVYLSEARRLGLSVRPPHINFSGESFEVVRSGDQQVLYMGLGQVRDLTRRTLGRVQARRPYASLEDFLTRVDPRPQEAENLVRSGSLAGLGAIPAMLRRLQEGSVWQPGQMSLFDWGEPAEEEVWTLEQRVAAQQELLGIAVDAHPLELVAAQISAAGAITTLEAASRSGQRVSVAGVRQSGRRSKTARGDWMMFLTLEDLEGMLDVVVWPEAYRRSSRALGTTGPVLVTGILEMDVKRGEPLLVAEEVTALGGGTTGSLRYPRR